MLLLLLERDMYLEDKKGCQTEKDPLRGGARHATAVDKEMVERPVEAASKAATQLALNQHDECETHIIEDSDDINDRGHPQMHPQGLIAVEVVGDHQAAADESPELGHTTLQPDIWISMVPQEQLGERPDRSGFGCMHGSLTSVMLLLLTGGGIAAGLVASITRSTSQ
ncbi:hypothetical protein BV898_11269 [Hypsibius exemplaris]|uniref:Uncharacterized protein n=1 Tax=Hypsibius exemplaris TaxID=2072580 RepID=A0A1W0WH69_HYPEX|nr:hypothetical protein BV898_11269 [Hypsibius exemplaris]